MKALLKILLGVHATLLVGVLSIPLDVLPGSAAAAQRMLAERATRSLAENGAAWARVRIDGQKVILSGAAPSSDHNRSAADLARRAAWTGGVVVGGVTVVDSTGVAVAAGPPLADPFLWIVERQGGAVVFSGHAPSQEAKNEIFQLGRTLFPDAEISGDLDIARGGPEETDWLNAASISLRALARLEEGSVEANGAAFILNGEARDQERAEVLRRLMAMLPATIEGTARIDVAPPEDIEESAADINADPNVADGATDALADAAVAAENARADQCRARLQETIGARRIGFASARRQIDSASRAHLQTLAAALIDCPQFRLAIIGHADARGDERRNRRLSGYRADVVAAFLIDAGVSADRLQSRGVGSSEPIASNATAQGRERNRRIEFDLIFDPQ